MEREAAVALLGELMPRLRRLAASLCGRSAVGDRLVANSTRAVLADLEGFAGDSRFDGWVFGKMVSLFLAAPKQVDGVPQISFDGRVTTEALKGSLAALPRDQRAAVALTAIEGLSYGEAARCLELPVRVFIGLLIKARRRLIDDLGGFAAVAGERPMAASPQASGAG